MCDILFFNISVVKGNKSPPKSLYFYYFGKKKEKFAEKSKQ